MAMTHQQRFEKARAIYLREMAERKVVTDIKELPVSYELISDEWLTKALCVKTPGAAVISHKLDVPDEGTSNRRRIFITYNEIGLSAGLPRKVFCKACHSIESRFVIGLNRMTEGETAFFNFVRQKLDIEAPVGLFARVDTESLNSILIMEDISDRVQFCDYSTPVSLAHARSQVKLLANLHGKFYHDPELKETLCHFQFMPEWSLMNNEAFGWIEARVRGLEAAKAVTPASLRGRISDIENATVRALAAHANLPVTLIHNDVHLKNWYITAAGEMGLADWQVCMKGCGVRDLVYAISTSLTIENRRNWENELIKYYFECLETEGGSPLTYEETVLCYRQQTFAALAMWTATLTPPPGSPNMQPPEASLEFIHRMLQAIEDWNALESF